MTVKCADAPTTSGLPSRCPSRGQSIVSSSTQYAHFFSRHAPVRDNDNAASRARTDAGLERPLSYTVKPRGQLHLDRETERGRERKREKSVVSAPTRCTGCLFLLIAATASWELWRMNYSFDQSLSRIQTLPRRFLQTLPGHSHRLTLYSDVEKLANNSNFRISIRIIRKIRIRRRIRCVQRWVTSGKKTVTAHRTHVRRKRFELLPSTFR